MKDLKLEELDRKILGMLNRDARMSFRRIAKKLKISATTLYSKVRELEGSGVIKGYIPLIAKEFVGYKLMVVICLCVKNEKYIEVQKVMARFPEVQDVYEVSGEWDLIIVCNFKGRDELLCFLKNALPLSNIERTITHLVLNVVKEERRIHV